MHIATDASIQPTAIPQVPLQDEDGFLLDAQQWTPELAEKLAFAAALPKLSETHFRTIAYVRDKYLALGGFPSMRRTCRKLGLGRYEIKALFGGCRQLWLIAGLPNPGEEAKTYLD